MREGSRCFGHGPCIPLTSCIWVSTSVTEAVIPALNAWLEIYLFGSVGLWQVPVSAWPSNEREQEPKGF